MSSHLVMLVLFCFFIKSVIAGVLIACDHCFHFFQENKSYGVEPFALILCLHVADNHVTNKVNPITTVVLREYDQ